MEIKTNNMKKQFKLRFSYCPFYALVVRKFDVNLNTAPPKLVIEASINWLKGTGKGTT
jgi:hypothetical protein